LNNSSYQHSCDGIGCFALTVFYTSAILLWASAIKQQRPTVFLSGVVYHSMLWNIILIPQ